MEPGKLSKYLAIAAAQRKRALTKFISEYGPQSNVVAECQTEVAELDSYISQLLKEAAASPKLQGTRK